MNQPASVSSLLSPQQLLQARYGAPVASVPAWPAASPLPPLQGLPTQTPSQSALPGFNRVSSLLAPDQLQRFVPPQSGPLANPLNLFGRQPVQPGSAAMSLTDLRHRSGLDRLKQMSPAELKELGESDKRAFFAALLPAAIESEKQFGVPAEVTLAQAALESGWARSPIGGFNIFGIKGSGPAGKVTVDTSEFYNGRYVKIKDGFAKYHNFFEAVKKHGELFHNGYYDKAVKQYARDRNVDGFVNNIHGIYATDPNYSRKIKGIIADYGLKSMVDNTRMV
ncbi:MAG TPA: glucosaminidase domain-containing protein [Candidatus Obscuribacterales bacterium]